MLIREHILSGTLRAAHSRLARLRELEAPSVVTSSLESKIEGLEAGIFKVRGDQELLQKEVETVECLTGRGGLKYLLFNGNIAYFPAARYGPFITIYNDKYKGGKVTNG